ncbi:hypothetical protein MHYP_G00240100 [Metynnis hypsauchen]
MVTPGSYHHYCKEIIKRLNLNDSVYILTSEFCRSAKKRECSALLYTLKCMCLTVRSRYSSLTSFSESQVEALTGPRTDDVATVSPTECDAPVLNSDPQKQEKAICSIASILWYFIHGQNSISSDCLVEDSL